MPKHFKKLKNIDRKLIHKKFVTIQILAVSLAISFSYLLIHFLFTYKFSVFFSVLTSLPITCIIWHRCYQILYDLKLLYFDNSYDTNIIRDPNKKYPPITFVIPSCHEPFSVAKMTFDSILSDDYEGFKEIIIVDNTKSTTTEDFVKWKDYVESFNQRFPKTYASSKFLYNEQQNKLKPGNLDLAQKSAICGEYVVILDVDSTLPPNNKLLMQAITEFEADEALGFIQFRIKATNYHFNNLTMGVAVSQDLLRLRMISRGYGGYKIFEGHNGIWRKKTLDEIGDWTEYYKSNIIITEDILKSAHTYSAGYYGKPLNIETGEWVPSSLKALEGMWMRWMYGNSQVFFKSFRDIYSKNTNIVEKFDISYHVLHHLITLLFIVTAIMLQIFMRGAYTNIFILLFGIIPQVVAAFISYETSVKNLNTSFFKKIRHIYSSFFMIETFIMFTQIKSDIKFFFGFRHGWKVTQKGIEDVDSVLRIILYNGFYISCVMLLILFCLISWIFNYNMSFYSIFHHSGLLFISFNLLFCVLVFSKQGRKVHNNVADHKHVNKSR